MTEQECFTAIVTGMLRAGKHPHEALGYPACPISWKAMGRSIPGCDDVIADAEYAYTMHTPKGWEAALRKIAKKRELTFPAISVE